MSHRLQFTEGRGERHLHPPRQPVPGPQPFGALWSSTGRTSILAAPPVRAVLDGEAFPGTGWARHEGQAAEMVVPSQGKAVSCLLCRCREGERWEARVSAFGTEMKTLCFSPRSRFASPQHRFLRYINERTHVVTHGSAQDCAARAALEAQHHPNSFGSRAAFIFNLFTVYFTEACWAEYKPQQTTLNTRHHRKT